MRWKPLCHIVMSPHSSSQLLSWIYYVFTCHERVLWAHFPFNKGSPQHKHVMNVEMEDCEREMIDFTIFIISIVMSIVVP